MMRDRVAAELNKEITIIFIFLYNCDRYEDSGHFTSNSGPDTLTVTLFLLAQLDSQLNNHIESTYRVQVQNVKRVGGVCEGRFSNKKKNMC